MKENGTIHINNFFLTKQKSYQNNACNIFKVNLLSYSSIFISTEFVYFTLDWFCFCCLFLLTLLFNLFFNASFVHAFFSDVFFWYYACWRFEIKILKKQTKYKQAQMKSWHSWHLVVVVKWILWMIRPPVESIKRNSNYLFIRGTGRHSHSVHWTHMRSSTKRISLFSPSIAFMSASEREKSNIC